MDNLVIGSLVIIIIAQAVERYFFTRQIAQERKEQNMAFLSKNPIDLAVALKTSKGKTEQAKESNETELVDATDEEFDKHIASLNK